MNGLPGSATPVIAGQLRTRSARVALMEIVVRIGWDTTVRQFAV